MAPLKALGPDIFQTSHSMSKHNSRKTGFMALKFDMSKAFDRVEWVFFGDSDAQIGL